MKEHLRPDYKDFTPADFALDELFIKWVSSNDPQTNQFWTEWLTAHPEKKRDVDTARAIVLSLRFKDEKINEEDVTAEWFRLQTRTEREDAVPLQREHHAVFTRLLRIAAIGLLVIGSIYILDKFLTRIDAHEVRMAVHHTSRGQKLSLVLPDGSSVTMNSSSTVKFPTEFSDSIREIYLEGEAFFDVVHNPDWPFKVHSDGVTTVAVGTSFDVKGYAEDSDIKVALINGRVRIEGVRDSSSTGLYLTPSEMITVDKRDNTHRIDSFNLLEAVGWKDGILYFDKVSFSDAITRLERWYDVDITIRPDAKLDEHWRFNGKFQNKTLADILEVFSYPDLFKYRIDGASVVIYGHE